MVFRDIRNVLRGRKYKRGGEAKTMTVATVMTLIIDILLNGVFSSSFCFSFVILFLVEFGVSHLYLLFSF